LALSSCGGGTVVLEEQEPLIVEAPPPPPAPPAAPPPRVAVETSRIRVDETIHFEQNSADISQQSDSLLQEIATVINQNTHIRKIRIEGHTDSFGDEDRNRDLSRRRARAVMDRLVANGVAAERLESRGYGHVRPVAPNYSDEGRAQNRRVELNIIEQDAPAAEGAN
jgi:outer membrane protein OmpA-like peptidoglycan-associated protein